MMQLFDENTRAQYALAGGDDYELLFTISPGQQGVLEELLNGQIACTRIGTMTCGGGVGCWKDHQPYAVHSGGYDHFANEMGP
jgi:thiamine-monophosphate kinase